VLSQALRAAGLIDYTQGVITILDRRGLEGAACECYAIIRREFDRLLAGRESPSPLRDVLTSQHGESALGDGSSERSVEIEGL